MPNNEIDRSFSKEDRLLKKDDFKAVFDNGLFFSDHILKIGFLVKQNPKSRLGVVVSKKHGNAPTRNRIKRLLRETFRKNRKALELKADLVIIPRLSVDEWVYAHCEKSFLKLVKQYNGKTNPRISH